MELLWSQTGFLTICLILLFSVCASCACRIPITSSPTVESSTYNTPIASTSGVKQPYFHLHILNSGLDDLELGYERERAWEELKAIDLDDSVLIITENDIEQYDWSEQSITLTLCASDEVKEAFTMYEHLSTALSGRGFVVTFQGDWLYGGVFMESMSPRPIEYPVIDISTTGSRVVFRLSPMHFWVGDQDCDSCRSAIEAQEVHDLFLEQGKLIE